jgi:hypothetical protein
VKLCGGLFTASVLHVWAKNKTVLLLVHLTRLVNCIPYTASTEKVTAMKR